MVEYISVNKVMFPFLNTRIWEPIPVYWSSGYVTGSINNGLIQVELVKSFAVAKDNIWRLQKG